MIGELRDRIQYYAANRIADEGGGAAVVRVPLGAAWAEIEERAAARDRAGEREAYTRRFVLRVRREDHDPAACFVGARGRILSIRTRQEADGDEPFLTLLCEEIRP